MSQVAKKWLKDNCVDHTKLDPADSYTVFGLRTTSDATVGNILKVVGITNLADTTVAGDATIGAYLTVSGPTTLNSSLSVSGQAIVNDILSVGLDSTMSGKMSVARTASMNDATFSSGINVGTDATIGGNLYVAGDMTIDDIVLNDVTVTGDMNVTGNILGNAAGTSNLGDATHRFNTIFTASNIDVAAGSDLRFIQDSTNRLTIKNATGRVGIGSTSPAFALDTLGVIRSKRDSSVGSGGAFLLTNESGGSVTLSNSGTGSRKFQIDMDSTASLVIDNAGNVGVGTANPQAPLNVYTTANIVGHFQNTNNSASYHGVWIDVANTAAATYPLYIRAAGTPVFAVTGSGGVGIGTTNPGARLQVIGIGTALGSGAATVTQLGSITGGGDFTLSGGASVFGLYNQPSVTLTGVANQVMGELAGVHITAASPFNTSFSYTKWISAPSVSGSATISNAITLYVDGPTVGTSKNVAAYFGGSVGIGTTSPNVRFKVYPATTGAEDIFQIGNASDPTASQRIFDLSQDAAGHATMCLRLGGAGGLRGSQKVLISAAGNTLFNGGNVGIGTATPGNLLHLYSSSAAADTIKLETSVVTDPTDLLFWNTPSHYGRLGMEGTAGSTILNGSLANAMVLTSQTNDLQFGAGAVVRMTVTSGGNVGIGTATVASTKFLVYNTTAEEIYQATFDCNGKYGIAVGRVGNNYAAMVISNSGNTADIFSVANGTTGENNARIYMSGNVGIGTTPVTTDKLKIIGNSTNNTSLVNVGVGNASGTDVVTSTGSTYGIIVQPSVTATGALAFASGQYNWLGITAATAQTITDAVTMNIVPPAKYGSATITNATSLYVTAPNAVGATYNRALYVTGAGNCVSRIETSSTSASHAANIQFKHGNSSNVLQIFANSNGDLAVGDLEGVGGGILIKGSNGNVGIGTTDPGTITLKVQATQARSAFVSATTNVAYSGFTNGDGDVLIGKESSVGASLMIGATPYSGIFNVANSQAMHFGTNNTTRMTVSAGGAVGIGTTNPIAFLQAELTSNTVGAAYFKNRSTAFTDTVCYLESLTAAGTGFYHLQAASGGGVVFKVRGDGQIYSDAGTTISSPADFAEWTKVQGDLEDYEVGDIVMQSDDDLTVCKAENTEVVYGVVTDRAVFCGGLTEGYEDSEVRRDALDMAEEDYSEKYNALQIAMVGHVQVKVTGTVKKNQLLTLSDIPGVAKAATTFEEKALALAIARQEHDGDEVDLIEVRLK